MRRQNIPLHALTTAVCVAFLVTVVVLPTPAAAACVYTARSCIRPSRDDPAACVCSAACGSGGTMLQYRYLTEQTDPDVACLLVRRVTVSCSPQPPPCAPTSSTSGGDGGDGSRTTAPSPEAIILEKDDDRTVLIIVCVSVALFVAAFLAVYFTTCFPFTPWCCGVSFLYARRNSDENAAAGSKSAVQSRTRCMPPPHQLAQQPATASPNNRLVDTGIYGTPAFAMQRPAPHRAEAPASRPAPGRRAQRSALAPVHTQHSAIETFAADAALLRAMGGSMPREAIPPGRRRPGDPLPQLASENGTRTREVPPAAPESEASYRGAAAGQARSSDGRTTPLSSLGGLNASSPSSLQGSRSGTPASGTTSTSPADAPNRAHAGAHHMNMPHRGTTSPPPLVLLPGPRYTPSLARRQHEHGLYVLSPPTNSRPQDMSFAAHPAPSPDRSLHAYSMALGVVTPEQHRYSRADAGGDLNHYSFASGASATPESRTYAAASGSAFATPPQGQQLLTRPGGDSGSGFVRRAGPRYSAYFRQRSDGSSRRKRSGSNGRSVAASLGSASGEELEGRVSERSAAAPHIYDRSAPRIYDRGNAQVRERSDPVYSHGNQPGTPSVSAADYTSAPTPEMLAYDHRTLPEGDLSDTPAGYATVAGVRPRHVPEYSRADAPPTPLAPVLPAAAAAASSPQYDVGTAETGQTHSAPQPPQSPHYALADEVDADTAADTAHSPPQYVLADPRQPKMSRVSEEGDEIHGAARGIDEGQAKPRNSEEEQAEPNVAAASSEEEQIEPHTSRSHEESEVQQVQDDATDAPGTPPLQDEV